MQAPVQGKDIVAAMMGVEEEVEAITRELRQKKNTEEPYERVDPGAHSSLESLGKCQLFEPSNQH